MYRIVFIGILVAVVMGLLSRSAEAAYSNATLNYIGNGTFKVGETSVVMVQVKTGTNKINEVDLGFSFDKSKLQILTIEPQLRASGVTSGANQPMFRGANNVLSSYATADIGTINSGGSFSLKGISFLFSMVGESIVAGESSANAVANLSTGDVNLLKIIFKDIGTTGQATLGLNKSYSNKLSGYNSASDDQELSLIDYGTSTDNTFKLLVANSEPVCKIVNPTGVEVASCPLRIKGDANCDGKVDPADFNIWRNEYYDLRADMDANAKNSWMSNFNCSTTKQKVSMTDFATWRLTCTQRAGVGGATTDGACVL